MIDKRDNIGGIPEGDDYAGTVLSMLQAGAGTEGEVVHSGKLHRGREMAKRGW